MASPIKDVQQSEMFLSTLIEHIPHMVFVKDARTLRYVRVNKAMEKFWKRPADAMVGKTDKELFDASTAKYFRDQDRALLRESRDHFEMREEAVRMRDGSYVYLHTHKIIISNAQGRALFILGISEDITKEKLQQNELGYFFANTVDMLCIANFEGWFLKVNPAFERFLGYHEEEMLSRPFFDFVHPDDIESTKKALSEISHGKEIFSFENRYRCRNGNYRRFIWTSRADVEIGLIYAVARDVTDERKLEAEILHASTREQERIARDLHDGLGQILTGIAYKCKIIEQMLIKGRKPAASQLSELVGYANQASTQARLLSRGLDPVATMEGLFSALKSLATTTKELFGVDCRLHSLPPVDCRDRNLTHQLYRIAQEAVNNAIKHGQASRICIGLKKQRGALLLEIKDNGIGIPEAAAGSRGLGLPIMEYRARAIGASLTILPGKSGGVVVQCSLPLHVYLNQEPGKPWIDPIHER